MDNILVYGKTQEEVNQSMNQVLKILKENNLYLKTEKCKFNKQCLKYQCMIITPDKIKMDPSKLKGIQEWPTPKTVRDIQKFIGFCNFYRKFIKHYSNIT